MLNIESLVFAYNHTVVLKDLSLKLHPAEIATLIGSSGSGKTTLLKLLSGIFSSFKGALSIGSLCGLKAHQQFAYMSQDDLLLPWRTVLDNLLLISELGKKPQKNKEVLNEALSYLQEVGLEGWEKAYPHQLSGGMRQRVSLARALMQKRPVLLLDEPFASLDVRLREQMHMLLKHIRKKHGTTILMVTHDFHDALSLSDRIFLLSDGHITKDWVIDDFVRGNPETIHRYTQEMRLAL